MKSARQQPRLGSYGAVGSLRSSLRAALDRAAFLKRRLVHWRACYREQEENLVRREAELELEAEKLDAQALRVAELERAGEEQSETIGALVSEGKHLHSEVERLSHSQTDALARTRSLERERDELLEKVKRLGLPSPVALVPAPVDRNPRGLPCGALPWETVPATPPSPPASLIVGGQS